MPKLTRKLRVSRNGIVAKGPGRGDVEREAATLYVRLVEACRLQELPPAVAVLIGLICSLHWAILDR